MKVDLLAYTQLAEEAYDQYWGVDGILPKEPWDAYGGDPTEQIDYLAEYAGRECYQSFSRPNPSTRANDDYLGHIIESGHFSVLEHASATFRVTGVSRSLTHELIRHRHLSYSQLSQRYVNANKMEWVKPPALPQEVFDSLVQAMMYSIMPVYEQVYIHLKDSLGLPLKQAREAARAVLPNMTETRLVVSGNMRSWRDVLQKRWHVAADAEIREFAGKILTHLRSIAPNSFQDIPEEPYGSSDE